MIKITFPDGRVKEYPAGVSGREIAESISQQLAKEVLAVGVDDETWDIGRP
ncbi:MAG: TGS domain-containing protein, partial [Bacteroidales bacterium]